MHIRELQEADLDALLELCRTSLPTDRFSMHLLRHHTFAVPDQDPAHMLSAWDGARLAGVMLGGIAPTQNDPIGVIRLFAVAPPYRRSGLGTRLLTLLCERLQDTGITKIRVGGNPWYYFWPGLDIRYTPAFCLLYANGFRRQGDAVNMQVDLTGRAWNTSPEEQRLANEGFTLRRLQPADRAAFDAWLTQHWSPIWRYEALASYERDPISTFIALRGGAICAFASYGVSNFVNGFGPTGTQPEFRGRGLGRVLLLRCLNDIKTLGYDQAEINWVGPITFYARACDAQINRVFWYMEKDLAAPAPAVDD